MLSCFSDDRLVHLECWVWLRYVGCALVGLDRRGRGPIVVLSSYLIHVLLAAPSDAVANLVTYRCKKGSQMIDVALQQRTTLTVHTRGRA